MDLGSILLIIALAVVVGVFVSQPLLKFSKKERLISASQAVSAPEHDRSVLLAERDRILTALQELDFDFVLGKIPTEDYPIQRAELAQAGAEVLRNLDQFEPAKTSTELSAEDRVEAAVAARRADAQKRAGKGSELDELDVVINARRRNKQEKSAGFCPKCGNAVQKSDVFCSRCGATL